MNAHYTTNKILFDWISITSKIDSVDTIIELLGLNDVTMIDTYGLYGYHHRMMYDGIGIHYGGNTGTVLLEMSGQGCRVFETYGNGDYIKLLSYVLEHPGDINITRLDVAYDDYNNLIELDKIVADIHDLNFVTQSNPDNVGYTYMGGAYTVNAGKRGSNIYMRIYDKARERNALDEYPHWVRCELQLRHGHALQFIRLLFGGADKDGNVITDDMRIDKLYFAVLNHYIRFIDRSVNNDSNKWRLPMAQHWSKFAESVTSQRVSLYVKPGVEYNAMRLYNNVNDMYHNLIYTYTQVYGTAALLDVARRPRNKLNVKYQQVINDQADMETDYWGRVWSDFLRVADV